MCLIHAQDKWSLKEIERLFFTNTPAWYDAEGFVWAYQDLVCDPASPVEYDRKIFISNIERPFPLATWWDYHRSDCKECLAHLASHGGDVMAALLANQHNSCWFADILSWLSGGWRIPLRERPGMGEHSNHASLLWSVSSMQPEIQRMIDHGVIIPGRPVLINPAMAVVRQSDIDERCRILREIGHPSPSSKPKDIDIINQHITALLAAHTQVPYAIGALKPIKVRFCLDLSILLNNLTKKWGFQYATVRDAVALLVKGAWMAKIDLER